MSQDTHKTTMSLGRKIWLWTAIVISVIVLIEAAVGVFGVWVGRGVVIDLNNSLMDGITKLASVGEETAVRIEGRVERLNDAVTEVESAVDQVSQNVSDKGLFLTLLPAEKEQNLADRAKEISETVNTITASFEAAHQLYKSIDSIPFVSLPKPKEERLQELESGIEEISSSVGQLRSDIQDFRNGAASEISKISSAAGKVSDRLQQTQSNLTAVESELKTIQTSAQDFKGTFSTLITIATIITSLFLLWVIYGMVIVIRDSWADLKR